MPVSVRQNALSSDGAFVFIVLCARDFYLIFSVAGVDYTYQDYLIR